MKFVKTLEDELINADKLEAIAIYETEESGIAIYETEKSGYQIIAQIDSDEYVLAESKTKSEIEKELEKIKNYLSPAQKFVPLVDGFVNAANIVETKIISPTDYPPRKKFEVKIYYTGIGTDYYRPETLKIHSETIGIFDTLEESEAFLQNLCLKLND